MNATERFKARVAAKQRANPKMTKSDAFAAVARAHPDLRQAMVDEDNGYNLPATLAKLKAIMPNATADYREAAIECGLTIRQAINIHAALNRR